MQFWDQQLVRRKKTMVSCTNTESNQQPKPTYCQYGECFTIRGKSNKVHLLDFLVVA